METLAKKERFSELLSRVVQDRTSNLGISTRSLADKLGTDYRSFMYWLEGERKFPAELVPPLCIALGDYRLLDELETEAGRVAYHVPEVAHLHNAQDVRAIQQLVKEVGGALESLSRTLEDGIVEAHELDETLPELDDVIRECARLKHWLLRRHHADFPNGQARRHVTIQP
jgi:hypothetical protein